MGVEKGHILLCNDDGYGAPGLSILQKEISQLADVYVIAPDRECSAISHAITLHRPFRLNRHKEKEYSLNGTPTDCIVFAINGFLALKPKLVISGINRGSNLADDISYSGTVAAAMEAMLLGYPAIAVSLSCNLNDAKVPEQYFSSAAIIAKRVGEIVIAKGLAKGSILNVNVPNLPIEQIKGIKVTCQGKRRYYEYVKENRDPAGKKYYWIGGGKPKFKANEGSDYTAVEQGYVSVTPLHYDFTNHQFLGELKTWQW